MDSLTMFVVKIEEYVFRSSQPALMDYNEGTYTLIHLFNID